MDRLCCLRERARVKGRRLRSKLSVQFHFAAGLLMPETSFRRAMNQHDPSLDAIEAVANQCVTSMTATAVRFAELTDSAVAVIVSTRGIIDYCFISEAMKSLPKLDWIRKGTPLPSGTATARLAGQPAARSGGQAHCRDPST